MVLWNVVVQPASNGVVAVKLVNTTTSETVGTSASGVEVQSTEQAYLTGFAYVNADAGDTFQLQSATTSGNITPQTTTTTSIRIMFLRVV